jgi:hypothetical protein
LLLIAAAVALGGTLFLAADHLTDRYEISHVAAAWIALTQYARDGLLYPPLFDGEHFGGTRFMPLSIVLNTAAAALTGEYVISGKIVGALSMAALLYATVLSLDRGGASRPLALALAGSILLSNTGRVAATSIRGDALPVALQLAALLVISRGSERRALPPARGKTLLAAVFCAAAVLAKLSALWAPIAIVVWFAVLRRDRGTALVFAASFVALVLVSLLGFHAATGGRMFDSVRLLAVAGIEGPLSLLRAPVRLNHVLLHHAAGTWALLPFAGIEIYAAARRNELTVFHVAFIAALALLVGILSDQGTAFNQLLDVAVLAAIVVGLLWRSARGAVEDLVSVVLVWVMASCFLLYSWGDIRDSIKAGIAGAGEERYRLDRINSVVLPTDEVLSEDPSIPVLMGQRPVVLDAWILLRMAPSKPEWIHGLADRISRREFDKIVLLESVESDWYKETHFGPALVDRIAQQYRLFTKVHGYHIYVPR